MDDEGQRVKWLIGENRYWPVQSRVPSAATSSWRQLYELQKRPTPRVNVFRPFLPPCRSLVAEELHTEAIRVQGLHDLAQVQLANTTALSVLRVDCYDPSTLWR